MDAYELTRPILSTTRLLGHRSRPAAATTDLVAEARRYVNQLPLGVSPGPAYDRHRPSAEVAEHELERSLRGVAAAFSVCVDSDEPLVAVARRLVRSRAIVAPAADAVVALLPVLRCEPDAVRLVERLVGYLDHRAEVGPPSLSLRLRR